MSRALRFQGILLSAALAGLLAPAACSAPEAPAAGPVLTSSDGVRVVDNPVPRWADGEAWRLGDTPLLVLGVDQGEPHDMLTRPDALRLGDGRIVVADRGALELRWFDAAGRFLFARGGMGEGPGEYHRIESLFRRPDDGIIVRDGRRLTVYGAEGELSGTLELAEHEMDYHDAYLEGVFPDGSLLAAATPYLDRETFTFPGIAPGERGLYPMGLFQYDDGGGAPRFLAEVPGREVSHREGQSTPFRAWGLVVPHDDGFYSVDGRFPEIRDHGLDGQVRARFRRAAEPTPLTAELREAWLEKSRENVERLGRELTAEQIDELVWPETLPMVRNVLVDDAGDVWMERHLGLMHSRPMTWTGAPEGRFPETESTWDVFDREGAWLGAVDLVPGRTVRQIGDGWVLMTGEDDAGVARVWLEELVKPEGRRREQHE